MILKAYNNTPKPIIYNTVDGDGVNIQKEVVFNTYKKQIRKFNCFFCGNSFDECIAVKDVISAKFTDYSFTANPSSDYCCEGCALASNLIKFNYIIDSKIKLIRYKNYADELLKQKEVPFIACISTSFKKHLFYKAKINYDIDSFYVQLENETILCNKQILTNDLSYISNLMILKQSAKSLSMSHINNNIVNIFGIRIYDYLEEALRRRSFQIALYLAQKKEITEEEAICSLKVLCGI